MSVALTAGDRNVALVTKENLDESATRYAQGGVAAAVHIEDSPELHLQDTVRAGAGVCDPDAVEVLVNEGPKRVHDLVTAGARFDRLDGSFALAREGGHTMARIVRAGGDATGAELQRSMGELVRESATTLVQDCRATDLIVEDGICRGIRVTDFDGASHDIEADAVVLATGGPGALFEVTTNPDIATADGLAMAIRAGAIVTDVEFVQFHPTALVASKRPRPLVSEAVRGEGAILRTSNGDALMEGLHPQRDLAPRDVVAKAVFEAMQAAGSDHVWLDATSVDVFADRFPTIYAVCAAHGIDPKKDWLPVAPAAHYCCGGVATDLSGRTSIKRLYACGEVACTGVHGANRLGSNSLLEGLVFGHRVGRALAALDDHPQQHEGVMRRDGNIVELVGSATNSDSLGSISDVQQVMTRYAGVVRNALELDVLQSSLDACVEVARSGGALHDVALAASTVVCSARARTETRGAHVRSDFPETNPEFARHLFQRRVDGEVELFT